jgi:hypothetical protein
MWKKVISICKYVQGSFHPFPLAIWAILGLILKLFERALRCNWVLIHTLPPFEVGAQIVHYMHVGLLATRWLGGTTWEASREPPSWAQLLILLS